MMEPTQAPSPDPNSSTSTTSLPLRPKLQSNETSDKVFRAEQENMSDAEHDTAERNADLANAIIETGKKKKKKSKSRGSKTKKKPSGYEEYYVDAPLTPAEYEVEKKLYDPALPATRRLEAAIQRYESKRRMNSERRDVFLKYLSYGGIKVGPKMFEGNDQKDLQKLDSEGIITATACTNIPDDREGWDIDFEAVVKGFFSSVVPQIFGLETEPQVDLVTSTVKNFINYILHHDVCPEYRDNIMSARSICDTAKEQLWKAHQAIMTAPGDFNMACSTLFGGSYFGAYNGDQEWIGTVEHAGMPEMTARKVVKFGLAGAGTHEQALRFRDLANASELKAKLVHGDGFEVLSITIPSDEIKDFYHEHAPDLKPLGQIRVRAWRNPELPDEDLPPGEEPKYLARDGAGNPAEYEFFLEEQYLKHYFVGMKVDAHIRELNCGIHYFDTVLAVYCAFHTNLPNEDMMGWKKPRDLRPDHLCFGLAEGNGDESEEMVAEEGKPEDISGEVPN